MIARRAPQLDEVTRRLREHQREWQALGVRHVYVFGSVARQQAQAESDLDLLIDMGQGITLFDIGRACTYFEDLFGQGIDVVEINSLRKELKPSVLEDAVLAA